MIGGYQIIDLTNISVALDGGAVAITDPKIKKQLLSLREYIEENYNFSKPLNNKLKPIMIRLRDAESGEELEGCLWGSVSIIDDNLSFSIDAIVNVNPSKVLQINVVFEQKEDEYDNVFYDIKTATYEYKGGQDSVIVTDIKNIPSATIKKLQCGDIVLKKDSSGYHAYIVSFRNATGICLTYTDASCVETQSYDKVGNNWVYNSEDKTPNLLNVATKEDIEGGTLNNAKPIYWHSLDIYKSGKTLLRAVILNNSSKPIDSIPKLIAWFESIGNVDLLVNGAYSTPNDVYIKDVLSIRHSTDVDAFTFYYFLQDTAGYSSITVTKQDLLDQGLSLQDSYINKIN